MKISNEIIRVKFSDGDYFKQEKVDYIKNKIINFYIVYKLTPRIITENGLVQVNGLFGNLKMEILKILYIIDTMMV